MTYTEVHKITLHKPSKRNLTPSVVADNQTDLLLSINNVGRRVQGWTITSDAPAWSQDDGTSVGEKYLYSMNFVATFTREDNRPPNEHELPEIIRQLDTKGKNPKFGRWTVGLVNGEEYVPSGEAAKSTDQIGYYPVELPDNYDEWFNHLYGLQPHITMMRKAIEAGINSGWEKRLHVALSGPPGCGKSDICKTLKKMLGDHAVLEFDATAMTSAGVIDDLKERDILPRIILIEEIEKASPDSLKFLLALADTRGEIRKTTARGKIERSTNCLVIATVNNYELFEKMLSNALESRFANKVFFSRPSREQLGMILNREIKSVGGSFDWAGPTLDYCDAQGITDPRQVISLCLTGADDWTKLDDNGKPAFVNMLNATSRPKTEITDEPSPFE